MSLYQETLTRKRRLSVNNHEVLALLDSGAIAGDFISKSIIDDLNFNASIIQVDNPKKLCSGLDNSCNVINSSIELTLTFLNEISNINESFYFNPRILQNSPIDIIIGRSTIKAQNLALKIPSGFFHRDFIKSRKNLFLMHQEPVVSTISNPVLFTRLPAVIPAKHVLSKRLKITEISEKPCTDHICGCQPISGLLPNDVTRTRAHKNKVEVAVNRLSDIPSSTSIDNGPCDVPRSSLSSLNLEWEQCFQKRVTLL